MSFSKTELKWLWMILAEDIELGIKGNEFFNYQEMKKINFLPKAISYKRYKNTAIRADFAKICGLNTPNGSFRAFFDKLRQMEVLKPKNMNERNKFYEIDKEKIKEMIDEDDLMELEEKTLRKLRGLDDIGFNRF